MVDHGVGMHQLIEVDNLIGVGSLAVVGSQQQNLEGKKQLGIPQTQQLHLLR